MVFALLLLALRTFGTVLAVAATGYALGRRLLQRVELGEHWERTALRTVVGLAALGWVLTLLALVGWLTPAAVFVVAAAAHALGWTAPGDGDDTSRLRGGWRQPAFWAVGFLVLPMLILPLYPPLHHDAGMYHLPFVRSLATNHRLQFLPELRFAAFPQFAEIGSVPSYWLAGDQGVQAIHCLFGALTALLSLAWGRRLLPERFSLWPAAIWVGCPLVVFLLGAAYVDLTLACFVTAGAFAWSRWRVGDGDVWLSVAGFTLGTAVAVKYLGAIPLAGLALAVAVRSRCSARALLKFAGPSLIAAGPMIGWIAATTGNPVFPFLPVLFGETPWSWTTHWRGAGAETSLAANLIHTVTMITAGLKEHVVGALGLPARILTSGTAPDAESIVSLGFACALGLGVVAVRRQRSLLALELVVAAYALVWSSLQWPDARLVLPVVPISAVLAAVGAVGVHHTIKSRFRLRGSPAILTAAAVALALPGVVYAWSSVARNGLPPTDRVAKIAWLSARRGEIAAVDLLNRTHPEGYTVYGLYAENARYFADGEQLGDWVGPHSYHAVLPLLDDPVALAAALCSMGADHLLVVTRSKAFETASRPGFAAHFRAVLEPGGARLYEIVGCPRSTSEGSSP